MPFPTFPILTKDDLPPIGQVCERTDIDFKQGANPAPTYEYAKDVAAMANTAGGGSLIFGATAPGNIVSAYPGIGAAVVNLLPNAIELSVAQRCRPPPLIMVQPIAHTAPDPVIVVNVWPSPLAPVGARIDGDAWTFPLRVGSQTIFLTPETFGTVSSVSARRAAALLLSIPATERNLIEVQWVRPNTGQGMGKPYTVHKAYGEFLSVIPHQNSALFNLGNAPAGGKRDRVFIPLEWIETLWREEAPNKWIVSSTAVLENDPPGTGPLKIHRPA